MQPPRSTLDGSGPARDRPQPSDSDEGVRCAHRGGIPYSPPAAASRRRASTRALQKNRGGPWVDQVAFLADALGSAALEFSAARRSSQAAFLRARRRRSRRRARGSWGVDMGRFLSRSPPRCPRKIGPEPQKKPRPTGADAGRDGTTRRHLRRRDGLTIDRVAAPLPRRASWRSAGAFHTSSESRPAWSGRRERP